MCICAFESVLVRASYLIDLAMLWFPSVWLASTKTQGMSYFTEKSDISHYILNTVLMNMRQILFCWWHFQWFYSSRCFKFANNNAAFGHLQKLLWNNQDLNILKSLVSSYKKSSSGILYLFIGLLVNVPIYLPFISIHMLVNISVSLSSWKIVLKVLIAIHIIYRIKRMNGFDN